MRFNEIRRRFLVGLRTPLYSTRIKYPDTREKLMQKRHAFSLGRYGYNFKATFMKFDLRVLFSRKNTLSFFQIFSFTGATVKKHLNSIRTAERTLCK